MRLTAGLISALLFPPGLLGAQTTDPRTLEREILKQLIEINTSDSARHTDVAAKAMAARLEAAGIPRSALQVIEPSPGIFNLVARYRGQGGGAKPIMLMSHLDVVGARREDWSFD